MDNIYDTLEKYWYYLFGIIIVMFLVGFISGWFAKSGSKNSTNSTKSTDKCKKVDVKNKCKNYTPDGDIRDAGCDPDDGSLLCNTNYCDITDPSYVDNAECQCEGRTFSCKCNGKSARALACYDSSILTSANCNSDGSLSYQCNKVDVTSKALDCMNSGKLPSCSGTGTIDCK